MTDQEALKAYAEKAAPVCGTPAGEGFFYERYDEAGGHFYLGKRDTRFIQLTINMELALWREHCRKWLAARRIYAANYRGTYIVENDAAKTDEWLGGIPELFRDSFSGVSEFPDYDSALIAAVQAIGKEDSK